MTGPKTYERLMSRILLFGVTVSSLLMAAGLLITSLQSAPLPMPARNPTLGELIRQLGSGQLLSTSGSSAISLMFAGLVLLMLTPSLRVITTLVVFRAEKDWKFVGIAALVFLLLAGQVIYSLR